MIVFLSLSSAIVFYALKTYLLTYLAQNPPHVNDIFVARCWPAPLTTYGFWRVINPSLRALYSSAAVV